MDWTGWTSLMTVAGVLVTLMITRLGTDLVMLSALIFLTVSGILTHQEALAGFSNSGLITVAFMYVIAAGIHNTGGLEWIIKHLLGRPQTIRHAQARVIAPVVGLSGFLNNTPVVATFIPAVSRWARHHGIPVPPLLMTLSYAAILGGTLTLIGTSTNLIVNGLYVDLADTQGFHLFDITWVSVPVVLAGLAFIVLWIPFALRGNKGNGRQMFGDFREYTVEMAVANDGPLVGQTVEEAGLRHLRGLYLVEIEREGGVVTAVPSEERLRSGDRLVFAGDIESIIELRQLRGLVPSTEEQPLLAKEAPERRIVEAVVAPECLAVGSTVRESRFREKYGAVVLAIARNGKRIEGNLGNTRLEPADTLLLEARPVFVTRQRYSRDFLLVNDTEEESPDHRKSWRAWAILLGVVVLAATNTLSMLHAAMVGALAMLASNCLTLNLARRSLDGHVLLTIACSFALGNAMDKTGAAAWLAHGVLSLTAADYLLMLVATYALVNVMTELITNNAAALLTLPIVLAITQNAGMPAEPFVLTLMMAASASFTTPLGYQTNLMIFGPGGFRFTDFMRAGLPLNLLCGVMTVLSVSLLYPVPSA